MHSHEKRTVAQKNNVREILTEKRLQKSLYNIPFLLKVTVIFLEIHKFNTGYLWEVGLAVGR